MIDTNEIMNHKIELIRSHSLPDITNNNTNNNNNINNENLLKESPFEDEKQNSKSLISQ